jgi:hypothetical protein
LSTVRVATLLVGAAAGLLGVPAASAASAADSPAAAAVTGAPIASLPFYGSGDVTGAGTGRPGSAAANAAVATACNAGTPISGPQWYALPAASLGRVSARVDAPYYPRGVDQNPAGTAFVDVASGKVLACGNRSVNVSAGRRVAVVAYYAQPVDRCVSQDDPCRDGSLRLYVSTTPVTAPSNDHWQKARTIGSLPFTTSVDTFTADDDGPAVLDYEHCLLSALDPVQRGTVWWRYKATRTGPAPSLRVDLRTPWNAFSPAGGFNPVAAVAELTPTGPVPAPRSNPDDCDSPVLLQAGHTYLFAVFVFVDGYYEATPVGGGPLNLRVGTVRQPRVPTGVSVAVDRKARRATLRWSKPADAPGAGPVTGYRVSTDRRNARGAWVRIAQRRLPASARAVTVRGLTSSQGYRLRVSAVNRAGTGTAAYQVLSPR